MISKKESILNQAMNLFASQGFFAVSTKQIAKQADVSEGLIFKHYGSKEGLLQEIFSRGYAWIDALMHEISLLPSPKAQLDALLDFPVTMMAREPEFWKLSFTIKLQHPDLYKKSCSKNLWPQVNTFISKILEQLWLPNPDLERLNLLVFFEWVVHMMIKQPKVDVQPLIDSRKAKY